PAPARDDRDGVVLHPSSAVGGRAEHGARRDRARANPDLLRQLQRELGMGMIFVTHDLGVAAEIADTVAVMYAGRIVESGPAARLLKAPVHPYTAGLLAPTVHGQPPDRDIDAIPGSPPDLRRLPPGCSFAPRCPRRIADCRRAVPEPRFTEPGRMAAC